MVNIKWQLEFYEDKRGNSDIVDFLEGKVKGIAIKHIKKVRRDISLLEEGGLSAIGIEIKELKKQDKIYELISNDYRILFFVDGKSIVLLSYFMKKSQVTPTMEITKAKNRRDDYLKRRL